MKAVLRLQLSPTTGSHWLSSRAARSSCRRSITSLFRQDKDGKFLWPGFGDNLRVLSWIVDRCEARAQAKETPIGFLPRPEDIDLKGIKLKTTTPCSS